MTLSETAVELLDLQPTTDSYRDEVLAGMRQTQKCLPSKLFYDERGSHLFEQICELDEYYLTRTELAIMQSQAAEMASGIGEGIALIELGSGASGGASDFFSFAFSANSEAKPINTA